MGGTEKVATFETMTSATGFSYPHVPFAPAGVCEPRRN